MGQIRKLTEAGESLTMKVVEAEQVAGNFGQQAKFVGENGDTLYLPLDSATRQLDRIPLTIEGCVGELLTFSRDPNPKPGAKPFWGIRVAGAAERAPTQSKRLPPPKRVIPGLDDLPDAGLGAMDAVSYERQAPPPNDHDAPEWVTGDIMPKAAPPVAPKTEAKLAMARAYLDLLGWVQADKPKLSDEAAQAAAATIWISWGQAGLR